jgi:ubiquinone/menaquinone biosynthesis C-methylase UbiE
MVMKLTPQEEQTIQAYDQNASAWAGSRNQKGVWGDEKKKFFSYLPTGRIIEVGSGGGRDAKEFIEHGYDYTGTDISKGLLEEARKNNPGVPFTLQSVYELDFPDESFDGFWASAVLLHMPKDRIDEAIQSLRRVLKTQGIGFISLKKGDGEKFVEGDHVGITYKRFFSFYQAPEFTEILKRNHFEILETYEFDHSNKKWLAFFVKKN